MESICTADWLAESIRSWREARGFSPEQAARRLDVTAATWQEWEAGIIPGNKQLKALAELGVYIPIPFKERSQNGFWRRRSKNHEQK